MRELNNTYGAAAWMYYDNTFRKWRQHIKTYPWGVLYWEFYAKAMAAGFASNQRLLKGTPNNDAFQPLVMPINSRFVTGMLIKFNANSLTTDSDTFVPHVKGATLYPSVSNNNQMQVSLQIPVQTLTNQTTLIEPYQ